MELNMKGNIEKAFMHIYEASEYNILDIYDGMTWNEHSTKDEASILARVLNVLDKGQVFPYQTNEVYGYLSQLIDDTLILRDGKLLKKVPDYANNKDELTTESVKDFLKWVNDNATDHCAVSNPETDSFMSNFQDMTSSEYRLSYCKG